ncbi:MAG: BsuPI-related putative proteinase inhibitor [Bryobacteraceae bacterium]|nr:BsuPI-related putative proteinase inhibitor [Bryobacteraceae bacterium]
MRRVLPVVLLLFLFAAATYAQADYLPLEPGNFWQYRADRFGATFTVRVGAPALIDNKVYHRLTGYVEQPLWVRHESDTLYYRDEERQQDVPLTVFTPRTGGWFEAPFRGCPSEGQAQERTVFYSGPAGRLENALQVLYRSFGCADTGTLLEIYRPSVGMLRRDMQTIAGPVAYNLVAARIGKMQLNADAGAGFRVSVTPSTTQPGVLTALLRLTLDTEVPLAADKPVGMDYDLELKTAAGESVWRWSADKVFPAAIERVMLGPGEVSYQVEVPMNDRDGSPLRAGRYTLEAWLTVGLERVLYSSAVAFEWPLTPGTGAREQ